MTTRLRTCATPHVLGIHGDWGSGKTSFMRQVQCALGGDMPSDSSVNHNRNTAPNAAAKKLLQTEIITVWFDAWRYQNEPVPVVPLLHEMRRQMTLARSVAENLKRLGTVTAYGILDGLSDIAKVLSIEGLPSVEKLEKRGEQWERDHFETSLQVNSLREHLSETIKHLLPQKNSRAVIFIDDLDRCNPKSAVRLLEALKIYLCIPRCVFVLGMNERILVDAIKDEISGLNLDSTEDAKLRANQLRASHYLEKICSDIYRIPLPKSTLSLFAKLISDTDHQQALTLAVKTNNCLPPNPRRLKALSNQWHNFAEKIPFPINGVEQEKIWAVRVLIVCYIHQFHRDLWERWQFNPDFWEKIRSWCNGDSSDASSDWMLSLRLTRSVSGYDQTTSRAIFSSSYPNPGDVNIFWISTLIAEYSDQLTAADFSPLLNVHV